MPNRRGCTHIDLPPAILAGMSKAPSIKRLTRFQRVRRLLRRGVLIAFVWLLLATWVESRRLGHELPRTTPAAPELDAQALHADLATLAGPEMEGREAARPGGLRARAWIVQRFTDLGLRPLDARGLERPFQFIHRSIKALWRRDRPFKIEVSGTANVVGQIPGSDPSAELLLVSAHYDHLGIHNGELYPGADDNASGVAALLALAAWMHAHPPRHTLIFAAFDAEELGLRGSQALAADPALHLDRLAAVLNMDMISRPDGGGLVISGTGPNPQLRPLVEAAAAEARIPVRLGHDRPMWRAGFVDDWTTGSDQGTFAELGIPYLYLGVEDHADYHQPTDTVDKVPADFHAAVAELALDLLRRLDQR